MSCWRCANKDCPCVTEELWRLAPGHPQAAPEAVALLMSYRSALAQLKNHLPKYPISVQSHHCHPLVPNEFTPPTPEYSSSFTRLLDTEPAASRWGTRGTGAVQAHPGQVPASTLPPTARRTCRQVMSWPEQTGDITAPAAHRHLLSILVYLPLHLGAEPLGTAPSWPSADTGCCEVSTG